MKYNVNFKIEYGYEKLGLEGKFRYYFYRIKPSELRLFKRLFCNPWRKIFHAYDYLDGYCYVYEPKEYYNDLAPLKTFGDISNYLEVQKSIIENRRQEGIKNHEIWPD